MSTKANRTSAKHSIEIASLHSVILSVLFTGGIIRRNFEGSSKELRGNMNVSKAPPKTISTMEIRGSAKELCCPSFSQIRYFVVICVIFGHVTPSQNICRVVQSHLVSDVPYSLFLRPLVLVNLFISEVQHKSCWNNRTTMCTMNV